MFVKTKQISDYLPEEQVHVIYSMINDNIEKTFERNPEFKGENLGQILVTNCTSLKGQEVNALVSFRYRYDQEGVVVYFLPEEVAIYDDNDDEGVNYMLDHRKTKEEIITPAACKLVDSSVGETAHSILSFSESKLIMLFRLREEFKKVNYITGEMALNIIEKIFKETK